jgi:pimeloyl-ACP methyl ester carboxylesterase
VTERMIEANGVELCTEPFGDPADPPILLVMGNGASMLWWDERFCRMLAKGGRFVVRYDHRDTGRCVTDEPGRPGYSGADLVADAAGVLDTYEIPAAHVVGLSAGGALAQLLALLVIHGTADPMFPIGHGEVLADEVPGARLLRLEGAGHGLDRADWEVVVEAILEHT